MRIIYSAGDRFGANNQLYRFLENCPTNHEVKVAAFINSSISFKSIDWISNSFYEDPLAKKARYKIRSILGVDKYESPPLNYEAIKTFVNDVEEFKPDLIISDFELVSAFVARLFNIPLWIFSPLHIANCFGDLNFKLRYESFLYIYKKRINIFPKAERKLIYSPFGDINGFPKLQKGFEWISPYTVSVDDNSTERNLFIINDKSRIDKLSNIISYLDKESDIMSIDDGVALYKYRLSNCNQVICAGDTDHISDAIYNNKCISITSSIKDIESLLNALFVSEFGLGQDMGQIELMEKYSLEYLESYLKIKNKKPVFKKRNKFIHEFL
jgi:hypothetical protein